MPLFRRESRDRIRAIRRRTLEMILESSKSSYPEEFGALLRATEGVISELILLPGTITGKSSSIFQLHMLPIDYSVIGSAHSHPTHNFRPSGADLTFFEHFGRIHLIVRYPFGETDWAAYNLRGEKVELEVVD